MRVKHGVLLALVVAFLCSCSSSAKGIGGAQPLERGFYRISAWVLLSCVLQGVTGTAGDVRWHTFVGRDQFWTPPHLMIYTAVGFAGLAALSIVLLSTLRHLPSASGVDNASTIRVLWLFHAPLGFVFTGFGALIALVAGPLDNYWHELYGIDVTLWSPFHVMGITGGVLAILGFVYVFASEAAIERQEGKTAHRFLGLTMLEWGALLVLAVLIELPMAALLQFPAIMIGPLHIVTYPLPLTFAGALCLRSAVFFTGKPGAATLLALLLTLYTLLLEAIIPCGLRSLVVQQGLTFRHGLLPPLFDLNAALMPLVFLASALFVDGGALRQLRRHGYLSSGGTLGTWFLAALLALLAQVIPLCIVHTTTGLTHVLLLRPAIVLPPQSHVLPVLLSLPLATLVGVVGTVWGTRLGEIWHWSTQ